MADKTSIEWTRSADGTAGATWNPIRARDKETGKVGWFCEHASDGCKHCYAEGINHRLGTSQPYVRQSRDRVEIFLDQATLLKPLRWRRPRNIFPCSMTDLFGEFVPDAMRDAVFAVAALAPQHTFQVLTKRSDVMRRYLGGHGEPFHRIHVAASIDPVPWCWIRAYGARFAATEYNLYLQRTFPLPNVHLGVSIESRRHLDRLDDLRATPAAVRWVSIEPLLEDLGQIDLAGIDWVVVGGESGSQARPTHPDWVRSLRDHCVAAEVPFFFKQWGAWAPHRPAAGGDLGGDVRADRVRIVHPTSQSDVDISIATGGHNTIPGSRYMARVGKKAAGAMLDGREWRQFPAATP